MFKLAFASKNNINFQHINNLEMNKFINKTTQHEYTSKVLFLVFLFQQFCVCL